MSTIELCIHPLEIKSKQEANQKVGMITNELPYYANSYHYNDMVEKISNGCTWSGGIFEPRIKRAKNWVRQTVFAIDVDNNDDDKITVEELKKHYDDLNCSPSFSYHSFSSTEDQLKFRLVWVLDEPISQPNKAINFKRWLILNSKGFADSCTINLDRLFFGGKNLINYGYKPIDSNELPQWRKKIKEKKKSKRSNKIENKFNFLIARRRVMKAMSNPSKGPWITRYKTIFNGAVYLMSASNGSLDIEWLYEFFISLMNDYPEHWETYHHSLKDIETWLERAIEWSEENVLE